MKIRFNLQYPKKDISPIMISLAWDGNRVQSSIGISVNTKNFDKENHEMMRNSIGSAEVNNKLNILKSELKQYYFTLVGSNKIVEKNLIQKKLNELLHKKVNNISIQTDEEEKLIKKIRISDILNHFIQSINSDPTYKSSTLKRYKSYKNLLIDFFKDYKDIEVENFNKNYLIAYINFLSKKRNMNDLSIKKSIVKFGAIFNKAFEDSLINNQNYKSHFKSIYDTIKFQTESKRFALNIYEVEKIEKLIPNSEDLVRIKDMFLFEIYTGIRCSDLDKVSQSNLDFDNNYLTFHQKKTNELVTIPLINKAIEIIKKYPNNKFPKISPTNYNLKIKSLCREAGIDDEIEIQRKSLNKIETKTYKKWELISSHFARVTCIVEMARNGALAEEIITVTGHRDVNSIKPYMKISKNEKLKRSKIALEKAFGGSL